MGFWQSYRLRLQRKKWRIRSLRKRRELSLFVDRTEQIRPDDILLFSTIRNEDIRLPYFLKYYRELGVRHFLLVDNDSDDGSAEFLARQPDVSLWRTGASYKRARFGIDWITWLQRKYAHGHWTLVVDPDELFVYPFCDTRPIKALTDWLDALSIRSFGAMLVDMYPKGPVDHAVCERGQNPLEVAPWFDSGNYMISKNYKYGNLWIQGGPRARAFFPDEPELAPSLNKIPLVKWDRKYVYVNSTHMLLPRGLNLVYDELGGEKASGALLHTKFISVATDKAREELDRGEHFANSREYKAYAKGYDEQNEIWCKWSEKYINWRQLEILGLMSKGNWA